MTARRFTPGRSGGGMDFLADAVSPIPKQTAIRSKAIRRAAKGERCTLNLPCCVQDWSTTVLAHLPDESHGMARKSDDISAVFACGPCHAAIDGRGSDHFTQGELADARDWYLRRALVRTWRRLIALGVVEVKP